MYKAGDVVQIRQIDDFDFSGKNATIMADAGLMTVDGGRRWPSFQLQVGERSDDWCILPIYAFMLIDAPGLYVKGRF